MDVDRNTVVQIIEQQLRYLDTMHIGRVTAINDDGTRVSVQPLVKRLKPTADNEDIVYGEIDIVHNIPLAVPRTPRGALLFKVNPGDLVELRAATLSMDELLTQDVQEPVDPAYAAHHELSDSVAVPLSFDARPATSTNADVELIGDDVRLGHPNAADPLVTDDGTSAGLQKQLEALVDRIESAIAQAANLAVSNAVLTIGGAPQPLITVSIVPATVPHTSNTRGS